MLPEVRPGHIANSRGPPFRLPAADESRPLRFQPTPQTTICYRYLLSVLVIGICYRYLLSVFAICICCRHLLSVFAIGICYRYLLSAFVGPAFRSRPSSISTNSTNYNLSSAFVGPDFRFSPLRSHPHPHLSSSPLPKPTSRLVFSHVGPAFRSRPSSISTNSTNYNLSSAFVGPDFRVSPLRCHPHPHLSSSPLPKPTSRLVFSHVGPAFRSRPSSISTNSPNYNLSSAFVGPDFRVGPLRSNHLLNLSSTPQPQSTPIGRNASSLFKRTCSTPITSAPV